MIPAAFVFFLSCSSLCWGGWVNKDSIRPNILRFFSYDHFPPQNIIRPSRLHVMYIYIWVQMNVTMLHSSRVSLAEEGSEMITSVCAALIIV